MSLIEPDLLIAPVFLAAILPYMGTLVKVYDVYIVITFIHRPRKLTNQKRDMSLGRKTPTMNTVLRKSMCRGWNKSCRSSIYGIHLTI
jgi:hypothetical protein